MTSSPTLPTGDWNAVRYWVLVRAMYWLDENDDDGSRLMKVLDAVTAVFGRPSMPAAEDLGVVVPWASDKTVRYARTEGLCDEVDSALSFVFGTHHAGPHGRWYDSDGKTCDNYNRDGFDDSGIRYDGTPYEEWITSIDPDAVAKVIADWSPDYRRAIKAALQES